jgi:replicative DNA helicase
MLDSAVAERDVLAAVLRAPGAHTQILGVITPEYFQVEEYKAVAEAIWKLIADDTPITPSNVSFLTGEKVKPENVLALWRSCTEGMIEGVAWNALTVRNFYEKAKALRLLVESEDKIRESPELTDQIISDVCTYLQTISIERNVDVVDIAEMVKIEHLFSEEKRRFGTGIQWLDESTGGIMVGRIWVIVAGYKMGKSTLARQMILSSLEDGASIDWYNTETSPRDHYWALLAQLASQKLVTYDPNFVVRPDDVVKKTLTEGQVYALNEARKQLSGYKGRLRIYGPSNGVADPAVLTNILTRNKATFGVDGVVIDHIQGLVGKGYSSYERINDSLSRVRAAIHAHEVFAILLSQMGEAAIKEHTSGEAGYSSGAKGSGDINAEADELILLIRGENADAGRIKIHLKLSRRNDPQFHWHTFFSGGVIGGTI